MIHLALIGLLGVGMLIWLITIRAWELSVTVELPAVKRAVNDQDPDQSGEAKE